MVSAAGVSAVALVLVCAACGSVGSPQDQYKARESGREDQLYPAAVLAQATDQTSSTTHRIIQSRSFKKFRGGDKKHKSHIDIDALGELQVGSGDTLRRRERHKRAALEKRFKRNSAWSGNVPNFSLYQPQTYQISRPYYVPVWTRPNQIPIYLPPQPVMSNPGYPVHNKPGPQNAYLPPPPSVTEAPPGSNNVTLVSKVDTDDGRYWDFVAAPEVQTTTTTRPIRPLPPIDRTPGDGTIPNHLIAGGSSGNSFNNQRPSVQRPSNENRPQQRPIGDTRPQRPLPPIDRTPGDGTIPNNLASQSGGGFSGVAQIDTRPNRRPQPTTTSTTERPYQQQNNNNNNNNNIGFANSRPQQPQRPQTQRPQSQRPNVQATERPRPAWTPPSSTTQAPAVDGQPTSCVWAIISCCSPTNRDIRYSCFERLGCSGAFWDSNPCDTNYTDAALNSAMNFFGE